MAGKYAALTLQLATAPAGEDALTMTFDAVGRLVGGLPASAYKYREWWANNAHSHATAWSVAGWLVAEVDLRGQRTTFRRTSTGVSNAPQPRQAANAPAVSPEALDAVNVAVKLTWRDAGEITLDEKREIQFPPVPSAPGLYRMTLVSSEATCPRVYVGETEQLRRRLQGYRRPGPTQYTNQRLNGLLREHLEARERVLLAIATEAAVSQSMATAMGQLDLTRKPNRLLAENAALSSLYAADAFDVVNLG